ncbi:MAG: hypothetical protein AB1505_19795, partial [Candidatus Latescibacterota bacterium]
MAKQIRRHQRVRRLPAVGNVITQEEIDAQLATRAHAQGAQPEGAAAPLADPDAAAPDGDAPEQVQAGTGQGQP